MRRALALSAAAVLVGAVGLVAFLLARPATGLAAPDAAPPPAGADPARTYVVDGRAYPCLSTGTVSLRATVVGTTDAVFVVDGTEVATLRDEGLRVPEQNLDEPPEASAVMPRSVLSIRCDSETVHRVEVFTDHPDGCALLAQPDGTFTEARNHSVYEASARLPAGVCSLTLRA